MAHSDLVYWFSEVDKNDVGVVGGKGANLGEMTQAGFPVPNGFIVSARAYFNFIRENRLAIQIKNLLTTVNYDHPDSLRQVSQHIKKLIMDAEQSDALVKEIRSSYGQLSGIFKEALVAVRSSATAEDLPTASFAGQQETYLNVKGDANLLLKVKEGWASLFEPRAIFYRHEQKFDHFRIGIAMVVQQMVESEKSGIMFTVDPVTNDKSRIVIEAIYGLGEMIVQGQVTPDHYEVNKTDLQIVKKSVVTQELYLKKVDKINKEVKLSKEEGSKQKITDGQIKTLAELGKKLEKHYFFPQDSEWAVQNNKVYLVQTRAITTFTTEKHASQNKEARNIHQKTILTGAPASPGIASGPVRIIHSPNEIDKVLAGDVLVAPQTNPDFVPAMKKAKAIVTEKGGRTSHAAIVSRELGTPAVVGAANATTILKNGIVVTVNGSLGEVYLGGYIQAGNAPVHHFNNTLKTRTKVFVNLAEPELAAKTADRNVDGVGLLRAEFMMAGIGVHPKKMIRDGRKKEFITKLADKIAMCCKPFNPRPVIYRASDFKTNEYRGLTGGKDFEPVESNPLLGYRGAFRYVHDPEVFELELEAIKLVRNKQGLKNLWLMLPFVRNVRELIDVKKIISSAGLYRSPTFKLFMMVEIPSNVILLDEFIQVGLDGVSIGSNDLTMMILGTDRDNSEVAHEYDEQNAAVLWAFERVITIAKKHKIISSICGQAPSLYPNLLEKLVTWGINDVSVSPDVIDSVREHIAQIERKM